jgi:hypothetical protein
MRDRLAVAIGLVVGVGIGLAACAEKTPPPQTPAAVPAAAPPVVAALATGPAIELLAPAAAKPYLIGTIAIASVDRLLANGTKLVSQAVPLPMDAAGLRDMLLTQAGLPAEVSANIDFAGASAASIIALDQKGKSGAVLAVPARGPTEAQKLIDALGKKIMTRGPATLVEGNTGGRGWLYRADNVVVLSDEVDALARGAQVTLQVRRPGADDVTGILYPDALARANGTDVKTAIDSFLSAMAEAGKSVGAEKTSFDTLAEILALAGDASSIEMGMSLDPARGLLVKNRFNAREGTRLASIAREVQPFALDPAVAAAPGPRFAVGGSSMGTFMRDLVAKQRARLAADKQPGAATALAYMDALNAATMTNQSFNIALTKQPPYLAASVSTECKDAAGAAKLMTAMAAVDTAAVTAFAGSMIGRNNAEMFDWSTKKESVGKLKTVHFKMKIKKKSQLDSEGARRFFGQGLDGYLAVMNTRVLITIGKDAKARLTALSTSKTPAPEKSGPLAEALAASAGRDMFYYVDFAPMLAVMAALAEEQRVSAIARGGSGPIPLVMTAGGDGKGAVWTVDYNVPVAAFVSVGTMIAAGMGATK